jgi:hypothetical protein
MLKLKSLDDRPGSRPEAATNEAVEWPEWPYRGLNYFSENDAPLFGQRDGDIRICAAIAGAATNKILLLHGRSGVGKSSFLRAGLLPRLEAARFAPLRTTLEKSPILIRCTSNPIAQIYLAVAEALREPSAMTTVAPEMRGRALRLLGDRAPADSDATVETLLACLEILSDHTTRPLLLVVDQSEEIFTLVPTGERAAARDAFFVFLQELCMRSLDVKLIVSLRTEYYGQFCDELRIDPTLTVSLARTAMDQYMLRGLRSEEQIVAAIIRPTLTDPLPGYGVPHDFYKFEFEPGLPELIAKDLVHHCRDASILPVMQLVCQELHRKVVQEERHSRIARTDYVRLGGVDGRVNAFIETSIVDTYRAVVGRSAPKSVVGKWKDVLASLVALQEGGALTTVLADEATLEKLAARSGITDPVGPFLTKMTDANCRLLRSLRTGDGHELRYSLGHDALAPALYQWTAIREERLAAQTKLRWMKAATLAVVGLFILAAVAVSVQAYIIRSQRAMHLLRTAAADDSPTFRIRMLHNLVALQQSDGLWSALIPPDQAQQKLINALRRAPVKSATPVAVAISPARDELAILDYDTSGPRAGLHSITLLRLSETGPTEIPLASFRGMEEDSQSARYTSIGYVDGLARPVVLQGGSIFWWRNEEVTTDPPHVQELASLTEALSEESGGFRRIEIAGGVIRISEYQRSPAPSLGRWKYAEIAPDLQGGFTPAGPFVPVESTELFSPSASSNSDLLATISGNRLLLSNRRGVVHASKGLSRSERTEDREVFLRGVSFAPGDSALILRNSKDDFLVYPLLHETAHRGGGASKRSSLPEHPSAQIRIPLEIQETPVLQGWGRPVIASAPRAEDGWHLAWVGRKGISVMDGPAVHEATPLRTGAHSDSVVKLEFGSSPAFIIAVSQRTRESPTYRIWNVSSDREKALKKLKIPALFRETCKIVKFEGSNLYDDSEMEKWFGEKIRQPCEGY